MLFTDTATRVHKLDQFDHREESETDPQIQNASIASDYSLVGHGRLCLLQCDFLGLNKNMYLDACLKYIVIVIFTKLHS